MSALQLAISPLTWTNDDMSDLGGSIALQTCLSEMAQAGFTGTWEVIETTRKLYVVRL